MNNKIRMLINNEFDRASISMNVGAEVPTLPLKNMQKYGNSDIFRSTDSSEIQIVGEFADLVLISALVLWRTNFSDAGLMRLELFNDVNQLGKRVYDSGEIGVIQQVTVRDWDWRIQPIVSSVIKNLQTRFSQLWFEGVFAKSYRITIKDPLNIDNQLDIARIYMGRHFSPAVNFAYGSTFTINSNGEQFRTDGGSLHSQQAPTFRENSFSLNWLNDADVPFLSSAMRDVTTHKDWFISLYPGLNNQKEFDNAYACKFTTIEPLKGVAYNLYTQDFNIGEC
ncbi:hypothetical protein [Pseudoalteromonas piratica]|uniref:Uncharacterized protein n=1 Tax=Pseudoalteromonas piratica TaxID=1348114 RepID=A0A0A7EF94_9GAMM|nr:hypothetical protein [Pseudoalteromonas piratica]AIY65203.1 hypothetical protein OM33_08545 [Pseudoalteromonas piratica]